MKPKFFSTPLLFLLPGLLGFAVFYILPFIISLGYSFMTKPVGGSFAGLKNYLDLLRNTSYQKGFINTVSFISISVPLNIVLSLMIALLINKTDKYGELFILVFLLPLVIPSGATVFFWEMFFSYNGWLNGILSFFGAAKVNWLDTANARLVMTFIYLWKNIGYSMVLFIAGINNIPREYYEAAEVDGAGALRKFRHVTLPGLLPTLVLVTIMSVINSFKVFKEIYLIMGAYPHESVYMLQHFMNNMFFSLNYQKLTTATTFLVVVITLLASSLLKLERRAADV